MSTASLKRAASHRARRRRLALQAALIALRRAAAVLAPLRRKFHDADELHDGLIVVADKLQRVLGWR